MPKSYLVRAKLEYAWDWKTGRRKGPRWPQSLPITFGPFKLEQCLNITYVLTDLGLIEPSATAIPTPDWDYPFSPQVIETKIEGRDGQLPEETADLVLERLEALLRLFQEGDVYLRRHDRMWSAEGGASPRYMVIGHIPPPIKAEPASLYGRAPYPLDDETLKRFVAFFCTYWDVVCAADSRLYTAVYRFSSSYERRTLGDRLTALVIALEALFGDSSGDSVSYKIALRGASWVYPPGEARAKAFRTIKKVYSERSYLVHGTRLEPKTHDNERIHLVEAYVRQAIMKFLDCEKKGSAIKPGPELDEYLFFRPIDGGEGTHSA